MKLLLEEAVDPDSEDSWGETPLLWAARNGHEAVVRLLLQKEVDPDHKDSWGHSPLSWASENEYETIVKLLLEKRAEVAPVSKDPCGQASLSCVAGNVHETILSIMTPGNPEIRCRYRGLQIPCKRRRKAPTAKIPLNDGSPPPRPPPAQAISASADSITVNQGNGFYRNEPMAQQFYHGSAYLACMQDAAAPRFHRGGPDVWWHSSGQIAAEMSI